MCGAAVPQRGDITLRSRLAIEVQVVSSGWRPAGRAPQHALKRRKQRATRALLQTLVRYSECPYCLIFISLTDRTSRSSASRNLQPPCPAPASLPLLQAPALVFL